MSKPAKTEETLTREELSFALMRIFAAGAKGAGEGYHEKVMAHDAAMRDALKKAEEENERLDAALDARVYAPLDKWNDLTGPEWKARADAAEARVKTLGKALEAIATGPERHANRIANAALDERNP
jgi:hypothetical protein